VEAQVDSDALRGRFVDALIRAGELPSPEWQDIFRQVPRDTFVPRIVRCWPTDDQGGAFPLDRDADRPRWLRLVYSDRLLIVVEDGERLSSSSQPSVMARFLRLLDVARENTILEIGTGTGYNTALLCERVGVERVTSIDIDADLVDAARTRLTSCGYQPCLASADGYNGFQPNAPYDRIIATCSVPHIPNTWVDQLGSGGVLVAPLTNGLLVGLRRQPDGALVGGGDSATFMRMRSPGLTPRQVMPASGPEHTRPLDDWYRELLFGSRRSLVALPNFYFGLQVPDVEFSGWWREGEDNGARILTGRDDGSWSRIVAGDAGGYTVVQCGPRRLWDLYESAVGEWLRLGRPFWDRFGLTVQPDGNQFVWLDSPDSEHRWKLCGR
jgi:protein-L-isoaspartate O-methyltransferase